MTRTAHRLLVFSDLDGTLLDHSTYDFAPAVPMLRRLRERGAELVLTSSKTEAELRALRRVLENDAPFVVENGSQVCIPSAAQGELERIVHGALYRDIRALLERLRCERGYHFVGFGDLDAQGVADITGLSLDEAALAKQRVGSEPLAWRGTDAELASFTLEVHAAGLRVTRGGRFVHVMGPTDKGRAVPVLRARYEAAHPGTTWTTVGLGDSANDLPLLAAVDLPVVVRKPTGEWVPYAGEQPVVRTDLPGPAGWAAALDQILARLDRGANLETKDEDG